jgi:hypothetical protein
MSDITNNEIQQQIIDGTLRIELDGPYHYESQPDYYEENEGGGKLLRDMASAAPNASFVADFDLSYTYGHPFVRAKYSNNELVVEIVYHSNDSEDEARIEYIKRYYPQIYDEYDENNEEYDSVDDYIVEAFWDIVDSQPLSVEYENSEEYKKYIPHVKYSVVIK